VTVLGDGTEAGTKDAVGCCSGVGTVEDADAEGGVPPLAIEAPVNAVGLFGGKDSKSIIRC
jgi:hypothetical protein